jgi:hypothetical protein
LAPEVDKTSPRRVDLVTFWSWLQKSRNQVWYARFGDFLVLAPDVIKLVIRADLMTFWYFVVVADEL